MVERLVVLRDTRDADGTRHLQAVIDERGDLVVEGRDYGDGVERIFGVREYEWAWRIRAANLPVLREALGASGTLLDALREHFGGERAAELLPFLEAKGIAHESWSRLGD